MSEVENESQGPHDLVVVWSSAGGVEALSFHVSTLPVDFPAAVVLAASQPTGQYGLPPLQDFDHPPPHDSDS
jgi:chemotaxis response regulator CheB